MEFIETGRLLYYKTEEPEAFHRSHSRNMAFRLAGDGIVCNVDADNFTGKDFAHYLNTHFLRQPDSYLAVDYHAEDKKHRDSYGRIACYKEDFLAVGGYDEQMIGYGYEDIDFCERLLKYGRDQKFISQEIYLNSIGHSHVVRLENEIRPNQIESVYLHYVTPFESSIIYLFTDQTFSMATIMDKQDGFGIPTLREKKWLQGTWDLTSEQLIIRRNNASHQFFNIISEDRLIDKKKNMYFRITDKSFREELKMHYPLLTNHQYYLNNKNRKVIEVNNGNFGVGTVIRNFEEKIILNPFPK
jgi:hypothetical protein